MKFYLLIFLLVSVHTLTIQHHLDEAEKKFEDQFAQTQKKYDEITDQKLEAWVDDVTNYFREQLLELTHADERKLEKKVDKLQKQELD